MCIMEKTMVLSSITYAMQASRLLDNCGIYTELTRSPAVQKLKGCGYGLIIDDYNIIEARKILSKSGIRILGVTD